MSKETKLNNRRYVQSYVSTIISITLVLFVVGMATLLAINAKGVGDYFKERLPVSVVLRDSVDESAGRLWADRLRGEPYVKEAEFISRDRAKTEMSALLGEDFLDVFDYNPLPLCVEIKVKADYVRADSLETLAAKLGESPEVREVSYQKQLVDFLNLNIKRIGMGLLLILLLLMAISFILIHNTVRLGVLVRRFAIHAMQMVGATRRFIRKPFMIQALLQGVISALLAMLAVVVVLLTANQEFVNLLVHINPFGILIVSVTVLVCGICICMSSTAMVINKLLRLENAALY